MRHDESTVLPRLLSPEGPARETMIAALDRLEEIIDQETGSLEAHLPIDLHEVNRRKSRSLLELSRASRALPREADPVVALRLGTVREKLARNLYLLSVNLAASQEISGILATALRDAESDGTYSSTPSKDGA
ncbi:MAG TPA: flagellar protein FlgN [Xanthobacteraceae bacterium]|uniref:flagellar protein FlgN n=1 Tax=Roseixanthobacter finlandensis TaxID=3119922 RepID=UPI0026B35645|nr:flagellar protein FlgN [Xanthobacteraceae bacterium]HQS50055.1 flagellar protein FlgN [Xanthobacteraceae bacterium]